MPTTHMVFEAPNTERPTETSCPAISAPGRINPHLWGRGVLQWAAPSSSFHLCPGLSPAQEAFKVGTLLHHQGWTALCPEIC